MVDSCHRSRQSTFSEGSGLQAFFERPHPWTALINSLPRRPENLSRQALLAAPLSGAKVDTTPNPAQTGPSGILYANAYNTVMRTTSYSDLRKNLSAMIDAVTADHEPIIITRDRGRPAAVLMSVEDFASYEETRYLLRSPVNAERLGESIKALEAGEGRARDLAE